MKKICALILSFVLLLFAWTSVGFSGTVIDRIIKRGKLIVGTTGHYPPFTVRSKDGKIIGFDMDLAKILANQMKVKLQIKKMPINELFPAIERGEVDLALAGLTITSERNLKVVFLGPYYVTGQSILGKKEIVNTIKGPDDMNRPDFTLVVAKNTTSEQVAKALVPKAHLVLADNMEEALKMVISGKANALFADEPFCVVSAFRNMNLKLAVSEPFTFEPLGVAMPQDDYLWINFVDNLLMKLNATGELKRLKEYWFSNPEWMKMLPSKKDFM